MREDDEDKEKEKRMEMDEEMHTGITSGIGRDCINEWKKENENGENEEEVAILFQNKMIYICINLLLW